MDGNEMSRLVKMRDVTKRYIEMTEDQLAQAERTYNDHAAAGCRTRLSYMNYELGMLVGRIAELKK